jgi:hypothetical protein
MTSAASTDTPTCPQCLAPMRLATTVPSVFQGSPVETRTFRCGGCETIVALNGPDQITAAIRQASQPT